MKEQFIEKRFHSKTRNIIENVSNIISEYLKAGIKLSIRQIYYQFVSRGLLENSIKSYKTLVTVISDARLAGLIDWDDIEDRTRHIQKSPSWNSGSHAMDIWIDQFQKDRWKDQPYYIECWIEKGALLGTIDKVCTMNDIPYFACQGYPSQSEMYDASKRIMRYIVNKQKPIIIHLGDHDPSGLDMTRDIQERLKMFVGIPVDLIRLALNKDQIEKYNIPPNPASKTDSRFNEYERLHGSETWELDALDPHTINTLIKNTVKKYRDNDILKKVLQEEENVKNELKKIHKNLEKKKI